MNEFTTYHFMNCLVRYFPAADYMETVFQDGLKCPAQFTFTPNDLCKAVDLGYAAGVSGVTQMHFEHELSHTFIAEALGEPYCPVLRSVAENGPCTFAWEREALVMDFQKCVNGLTNSTRILNEHLCAAKLVEAFRERFRK